MDRYGFARAAIFGGGPLACAERGSAVGCTNALLCMRRLHRADCRWWSQIILARRVGVVSV